MMKKTIMQLKVHIAEAAKFDLGAIWDYLVEESSVAVAEQFIERIEERFQQAAKFPFSGTPRFHLGIGLRVLFHGQYCIYYIVSAKKITVIRILHGARDLDSIARDGGFTY